MRLIDADALLKNIPSEEIIAKMAVAYAPTIEPKAKVIAQVTFDEDKLREIVHEAVERIKEEYDIVDRPRGEWCGTVCSNCGASISFYYDCNFCPNCGADMREREGE